MIKLKGKTIRHIRSMDTCLRVLSQYEGSTHIKLKVLWVNMGFVESYVISNNPQMISIDKANLKDWVQLLGVRDNLCLRNCEVEELV